MATRAPAAWTGTCAPAPGTHRRTGPQLWLGVGNREPLTGAGIYQMIARRGRQGGVDAYPHRFRRHFSHTWPDRGGPEGDLMKLNGWSSPQMLRRYGASARSARARRTYDRIMTDTYHRRLGRYPGRPREAPTAHEASGQQNLGQDLPDRPSRTPRQPLGPSCESVPRARAGSPWTADCVSPRKPPATPQKSHKSAFRAAS